MSQGFGPAGYPTRPPVSYQIKPTTVWVDPSSTGVTRRRGALGNSGLNKAMGKVEGENTVHDELAAGKPLATVFEKH